MSFLPSDPQVPNEAHPRREAIRPGLLECAAVRSRIESQLEQLGHFVYRRAHAVIALVLIVIALGATRIPQIELRTSTDEFLRHDDPVRVDYDAFLERFGRDDLILIAIEPPEIFDLGFLERLRAFHALLEAEVPHVREVRSLINARETRGEGDELIVGELLEDWPETAAHLAAIRARVLANPLYLDLLIDREARFTTVTVELEAFSDFYDSDDALAGFDSDLEETEVPASGTSEDQKLDGAQEAAAVRALNEIVARFEAPDFRIHAGGAPVLNTALMKSLVSNMVVFTTLSTLLVSLFLVVVFRRALGVIVPMAVALLSLLATLGTMGTFGIPAMPISEIVPSFLLSIGVGSSVHLIAIYLQQQAGGATREDAIAAALGHSGLPIIMTGLTTAGGIASFAAASMVPIAVFGLVAPIGILLTLVLTLLLCPALLAVLPQRAHATPSAILREPVSIRLLTWLGAFATRRAGWILAIATALVILSIVGMLRLRVSFDSLEWFPDDLPAKVAARTLDRHFDGSMGLELQIDSYRPDGLRDPAILTRIDRARHTLSGLQVGDVVAGKSVSIVDIVKEIHQALNEGRVEARVIPDDSALVAQELVLFENSGSDDLQDVVDTEFRIGRFTMRVPMVDGSHYPAFGDEVERIVNEKLGGRATASLTGMMVLMGRSFTASIETLFRSYAIALVVITPLMMLLLGSLRLGLIAMVPNLFPIVSTLGLMGWLGLPLEMFSLLIGSIALGLAVDDTIHFMHGFRRGFARSGSVEVAVRETLRTTGQALLFTSIVLSTGFLIYVLSDLGNLQRFGLLTAFSIVSAFAADILLAPALMKVMARFSSLRTQPAERFEAAIRGAR